MLFIIKIIVWYIIYAYYINNKIIYLLFTLYFIINKIGIFIKEHNECYRDNIMYYNY